MKSRRPSVAALIASLILATSAAHAASLPSITTIETKLCPVGGATALRLGRTAAEQDPALRAAFADVQIELAPFTEARPIYSSWSNILSATEFNGALPDYADNMAFIEEMTKQLEANGWTRATAPQMPSSFMMNPFVYAKRLPTPDGPRDFLLQFEAQGAAALYCGGLEQMRLSENESQEVLSPNAARPIPPTHTGQTLTNLQPDDCNKPEFREALMAHLIAGNRSGVTDAADIASDQKHYQSRLRTWLRWKMAGSGQISEEALWAIEEKVAPLEATQLEMNFIGFANGIVAIDSGRKTQDAAAECRGMATLVAAETKNMALQAERLAKVNAALEAEAKRLGILLD